MRKHFYLIVEHPDEEKEGCVQISNTRIESGEKNVETTAHIFDEEEGDFLDKRVVSLGYVDFEDESEYEGRVSEAVKDKLSEVDEQHLVNAGLDPDDVFDRTEVDA